jgi:hypothetical protein
VLVIAHRLALVHERPARRTGDDDAHHGDEPQHDDEGHDTIQPPGGERRYCATHPVACREKPLT